MSSSQLALVVIAGVALLQVFVATRVIAAIKKRQAESKAAFDAELAEMAARGERLICGPTRCRVREGFGNRISTVAISDRRLIVYGRRRSEIFLDRVRGVDCETWFNTSARLGFTWVVLRLDQRTLGLSLPDSEAPAWSRAIARL